MSNWHLSATCLPLPCIIQTTCRPEHLLQPLSHLDPAVTPVMVCRACDIVITVDATRNHEPACRPAIFHRKLTYVSRSFRPRERAGMVHKKTTYYLASSWHSFQIFGWNLGFHSPCATIPPLSHLHGQLLVASTLIYQRDQFS